MSRHLAYRYGQPRFVVATAQDAAAKVIQDHELIRLSRAEQTVFVKALLSPPAPGAGLRKSAAAYKKRLGRRLPTRSADQVS
jgi:uncharacterized protein (DUF1778 family)